MNIKTVSSSLLPAIGAFIIAVLALGLIAAVVIGLAVLGFTLYVLWIAGYNPFTGKRRGDVT